MSITMQKQASVSRCECGHSLSIHGHAGGCFEIENERDLSAFRICPCEKRGTSKYPDLEAYLTGLDEARAFG